MKKKILFITTEYSADKYLANTIKRLNEEKNLEIFGVGLDYMQEVLKQDYFLRAFDISCIGLTEAIPKILNFFSFSSKVKKKIKEILPEVIIFADSPEFNLRIARFAKKYNIKTLYFIPPTIWAWRYKRIFDIKNFIDKVVVVYPFELNIYKKLNIQVEYIPHPLFELISNKKAEKTDIVSLGLFAGSREEEIKRHLPYMLKAYIKFKDIINNNKIYISKPSKLGKDIYLKIIKEVIRCDNDIEFLNENQYKDISLALAVSGTITLELLIAEIPQVVIYKLSNISYLVGKLLVKTKYISLPNILAQKEIVPEVIQKLSPDNIVKALNNILNSRVEIINQYKKIKEYCLAGTGNNNKRSSLDRLKNIILDFIP